tara:strand:- start:4 stop:933 length:930 start_codon:yes stop_codon:yes gene_type:complete
MDNSFIRFEDTIAKAQNLGLSPIIEQNYEGSIQLLPGDTQPYIQLTNKAGGFTYDPSNFAVFIRVCREGILIDEESEYEEYTVTQNFLVTPFIDENGVQQIYFRIAAITQDFGQRLVYFRFQRYAAGLKNYYSNRFYLTNEGSQLTTRLDYFQTFFPVLDQPYPALLSTRLRMYYLGYQSATEVDAYYQITTEQNVNSRILQSGLSRWFMSPTNEWIFQRLESACYGKGFYLNLVRQYLVDALEYQPPEIQTINVSEQEFTTDPNQDDVFVPTNTNPADPLLPFLASNDDPLVLASSELPCSLEEYYQI